MGANYYAIVESQEYEQYAKHVDKKRLLVLDNYYKRTYETLDFFGDSLSYGPGPARNFAWDHSKRNNFAWHWVMDDNIKSFRLWHNNEQYRVFSDKFFRSMENFVLRYKNIAMAGPQYYMFAPRKIRQALFTVNTRIYSCNLIRNDVPFRWRCRWNEDTILSLDMITAGWCTVQFNTFLQEKTPTQTLKGGNTDDFYKSGTMNKSLSLKNAYPQYVNLVIKYNRPHHFVNYHQFTHPLVRRDDYDAFVRSQTPVTFSLQDSEPRTKETMAEYVKKRRKELAQ